MKSKTLTGISKRIEQENDGTSYSSPKAPKGGKGSKK